MEVDRIGVKFFVADGATALSDRAAFLHSLVPVFHTWIQKQAIEGHLLIDVHDYSHIYSGPGILLVGHEGNFSLDMTDGRPGLLYYRKQPLTGSADERVAAILAFARQATRLLEDDPAYKGRISFRSDELLIFANDRLNAPNVEETFTQFHPAISSALQRVFESARFELTPVSVDPKERFAVQVKKC